MEVSVNHDYLDQTWRARKKYAYILFSQQDPYINKYWCIIHLRINTVSDSDLQNHGTMLMAN